jgi:hypothetical protein
MRGVNKNMVIWFVVRESANDISSLICVRILNVGVVAVVGLSVEFLKFVMNVYLLNTKCYISRKCK